MDGSDKAELRRRCRRIRRDALARTQTAIASGALDTLAVLRSPGRRVGLYWPVGHEPDLRGCTELLDAANPHGLALPVIESGQLLYKPWRPGDALSPDDCGIPAPGGGDPLEPEALDVLLVPALALDRRGIRLGSGGGWYDRLRADPAWRAIPALAVLPAACLTGQLPCDPWDVPFDGWLDEHGLHWC